MPPLSPGHVDEGTAGFTLVEMLAAIIIVSLIGTAVTMAVRGTVGHFERAKNGAMALSLAQSILAEVGSFRPLQPGITEGQSPEGHRWRLQIDQYGSPQDWQAWPAGAFVVTTRIEWGTGAPPASLVLSTLRLGAKGATP